MNVKQELLRNISNIPGWRTKRKIVVFESDDWGSIRMPSKEVYDYLLKKGIRVDKLSYNRYDSLESEEDLVALIDELMSIKDKNGNSAVFTLNTIVANPDFDKIKNSNFKEYYCEPFTRTYIRYPKHKRSLEFLKKGIELNIFKPQFHGREHLNVLRWLKFLHEGVGNSRLAFERRMFDLSTGFLPTQDSFMDAFNYKEQGELKFLKNSITEGTELFEKIFGYKSLSFIPPCYIWNNEMNETLKECGIEFFQGGLYQLQPTIKGLRKIVHFTGQKNNLGQLFLVRNVSFEPLERPTFDWVGSALSQISNAFFWHKPAIISTHRMNYIGFIEQKNRQRNLKLLRQLIKEIISKWPDVEFMSSDQLGNLIRDSNN